MSLGHSGDDPHGDQPAPRAGVPPEEAEGAVILVHGRGATAQSILAMSGDIGVDDVVYIAPQAAARTWYPQSFLRPVETNEPGRSSGLNRIAGLLDELTEAGVPAERTVLVGFSQGGCLAAEFAARNPRRYGGVAALSGGLIGPEVDVDSYEGSVEGTPVFLGCSDVDPHIPERRVHETREVFEHLDGDVTEKLYPGMSHTVNQDELEHVRRLVQGVLD